MKALHHSITKKAAKLGVSIDSYDDSNVQLTRLEDGAQWLAEGATPSEALEAVADGTAEFKLPTNRLRCGVMPAGYHAQYTANGGGCADDLDQTMRERMHNANGVDLEALKATGTENGVWNPDWARLNPGMQRMNLANRLRGLLRRGKAITLILSDGTSLSGNFGQEQTIFPPAPKAPKVAKTATPKAKGKSKEDAFAAAAQAA